eukprot:TRINITY_DN7104_c0_g1_i7.p1 TRINITY_DN7104_c0_g1~~TRINITY_DN7104_c0_g1_i7.p1  ORF type:complete len:559 (-),score=139.57 TRINITY_DN7104_c0_g1_i7:123-1799(-)
MDNYVIEVEESKNFQGNKKCLELLNERIVQPSFNVFIEVRPQSNSFVELVLEDTRKQRITHAIVTATLLATREPLEVHRTLPSTTLEFIHSLCPSEEGTYTAILAPGEYIVNAEAGSYKSVSEYFVATEGECPVTFPMHDAEISNFEATAIDVISGKPVAGTLIRLATSTRSMNVENLTNGEGKTSYMTDNDGYYKLSVEREGYVSYTKDVCISKNSLKAVAVPLIPVAVEGVSVQLCLSGDDGVENLLFKVYCPLNDEVVDSKKMRSTQNGVNLYYKNAKVIGSVATISSGVNEWYRVCIELHNSKFISIDKEKLDKYLQNPLQALNVVVHVILNGELKYIIYPPSNIAGTVWDLGFISAMSGELMAVNSISGVYPNDRLELCPEYLAFYNYISQQPNPRAAFGFTKFGQQKLNDIVMSPPVFAQQLQSAMKDCASLPSFFERLIGGISDLFGNVSFRLLSQLLNLNMAVSVEMEYSKSFGSPSKSTNRRLEFSFLKSSTPARYGQPGRIKSEGKKLLSHHDEGMSEVEGESKNELKMQADSDALPGEEEDPDASKE